MAKLKVNVNFPAQLDPTLKLAQDIIPNRKLAIYFASCIHHAPIARELITSWPEFNWCARWPIYHVGKVPEHPEYARLFWEHDEEDVKLADVVLCYGEERDTLRGALVEVGIALGLGKQVMVVGECNSYGTWRWHPRVHRVNDLGVARVALRVMAL